MSNSPDHIDNIDADGPLFEEFSPVSREKWEEIITKDLKGADYKEKLTWDTIDGLEILPFYTRQDIQQTSFTDESPGSFPFTRGHSQSKASWKIGQPIYGTQIKDLNQKANEAVENGSEALFFPFRISEKITQNSFELKGPDLQEQSSFQQLIKGIEGNRYLIFDCGNTAPYLAAGYGNLFDQNQTEAESTLKLDLLWDPLTEKAFSGAVTLKNGEWDEQLAQGLRFAGNAPVGLELNMLGINAKRYHNGGASSVQEIAIGLSIANEYLANLTDQGFTPEALLEQLFFTFGTGSSYFKEIAKLRAVRFLWAHIISQYGLGGDDQPHVPVYSFTSGWNKTLYDPHINLLRTTTEAMSATIGGCDLLVIQPFDQTFRKPDHFSLHLARNQQHLLKEESYFGAVKDPGGGSYYIETLTQKLAEQAWDLFVEIEQQGGFSKALDAGFIQKQIEQTRNERRAWLANRKRVRVGINDYPDPDARAYEYISNERDDSQSITITNTGNEAGTDSGTNVFETLQTHLKNGKTLDECITYFYTVQADSKQMLTETTEAKEFEQLRLQTERYASGSDERPSILIAPLGHPKWRAARANFAANVFGVAGYHIHKPVAFETVEKVVEACTELKPDVMVICSSDKEYQELCPKVSQALNEGDISVNLVLAGHPGEKKEFYESHQIDHFLFKGMDLLGFLKDFQKHLGVTH